MCIILKKCFKYEYICVFLKEEIKEIVINLNIILYLIMIIIFEYMLR